MKQQEKQGVIMPISVLVAKENLANIKVINGDTQVKWKYTVTHQNYIKWQYIKR